LTNTDDFKESRLAGLIKVYQGKRLVFAVETADQSHINNLKQQLSEYKQTPLVVSAPSSPQLFTELRAALYQEIQRMVRAESQKAAGICDRFCKQIDVLGGVNTARKARNLQAQSYLFLLSVSSYVFLCVFLAALARFLFFARYISNEMGAGLFEAIDQLFRPVEF